MGENEKTQQDRDRDKAAREVRAARKAGKLQKRAAARKVGRAGGVRFARWRGGVALAKGGARLCLTVGSPEKCEKSPKGRGGVPEGYSVMPGGAK